MKILLVFLSALALTVKLSGQNIMHPPTVNSNFVPAQPSNQTATVTTPTLNQGLIVNVSNIVASARAGSTIHLSAGSYIGGDKAIWVPNGVGMVGDSPETTALIIYNTSPNGYTNGGALWLSDNTSLENFFLNQTNVEGWPIATIGAQRKCQISPAQTAGNLAATSTNVTLRNMKIVGAKTGGIVLNCTNTFDWDIINCDVSAKINAAIVIGLARTTGDGPTPSAVVNPLDKVTIVNTSVAQTGGGGTTGCGVLVNFSGTANIGLNNVTVTSSSFASGVTVAGTNATIYLAINGTQSYPNTVNAYSLFLTGTSNTVYCLNGVFNYADAGVGNVVIFQNQPGAGNTGGLTNVPGNIITGPITVSSYGFTSNGVPTITAVGAAAKAYLLTKNLNGLPLLCNNHDFIVEVVNSSTIIANTNLFTCTYSVPLLTPAVPVFNYCSPTNVALLTSAGQAECHVDYNSCTTNGFSFFMGATSGMAAGGTNDWHFLVLGN
jgi:hypothetical protein